MDAVLFRQNARKTGHNVVQISLRFKCFTGPNLLEYEFNIVQNCETDALQFILFDGAYFLLAVTVEGDESSRQFWPATGPY